MKRESYFHNFYFSSFHSLNAPFLFSGKHTKEQRFQKLLIKIQRSISSNEILSFQRNASFSCVWSYILVIRVVFLSFILIWYFHDLGKHTVTSLEKRREKKRRQTFVVRRECFAFPSKWAHLTFYILGDVLIQLENY